MIKTENNLGKKNSTPYAPLPASAEVELEQINRQMQAWNEGCKAYHAPFFLNLFGNPYPKDTYLWTAWEAGYSAASWGEIPD